jgi:hypothetical protein
MLFVLCREKVEVSLDVGQYAGLAEAAYFMLDLRIHVQRDHRLFKSISELKILLFAKFRFKYNWGKWALPNGSHLLKP